MNREPLSNTKETLYLHLGGVYGGTPYSLREIIDQAKHHFPNAKFEDINISTTQNQESGCGCHPEPSDYVTYFEVTWNRPKEVTPTQA